MDEQSREPTAAPQAGWYPDPDGQPLQRWWNGTGWTDDTQPTPEQGGRRRYNAQTLVAITAIGMFAVWVVLDMWLHPGHLGDQLFLAATAGPVLSGGVVPRWWDDDGMRALKRIVTAVLASAAVTMVVTLSAGFAAVIGLVVGLPAAGFYTFVDRINSKNKTG